MSRDDRGQTLVEFALVSTVMLVLVLGIIDFAFLFASRASVYQSTRNAARFAATHPTAWTAAATPAGNTIEGALSVSGVPASVPNDDAHITISYLVPGAGAATLCGKWSVTAGSFQAQPGYTQATCVVPGTVIRIQASFLYRFITPMLKATFQTVTISTDASVLEET